MFDLDSLREYLLSFKYVTEESPFGPGTLVYKVCGKMFALLPIDREDWVISLKNTPERNIELREEYAAIEGAYHMNKTHWNMLQLENGLKTSLIKELVLESYNLVYVGLPRKTKAEFPL
jgi:predicted DNA-binding protein (MmcQ/YjbR family)